MCRWKTTGLAVTLTGCFALGARPAVAVDTDFGLRVDLGYDSNPLRISGDGPDGAYTQLRLDGGLKQELSPRVKLFADASARARINEPGVSRADDAGADLRAGISLSSIKLGRGRLALALGGSYLFRRSTYTDRITGEVAVAPTSPPTDPPSAVSIPERFDYNASGAFLDARWNMNRRLQIFFKTLAENADYVENYSGATALEPIDYRSLTLEPGAVVKLSEPLGLGFSVLLNDLEYERQTALDEQGVAVPDTRRRYRYHEGRVTLYLNPSDDLKLRFGMSGGDRVDTYAGFYDHTSVATYATLERRLGDRNQLQLLGSIRSVDYERAFVAGDPDGELLGSSLRRVQARFERKLERKAAWFCEGGVQRAGNRDPEYAYQRGWVATGFEIKR